MSDEQPGMPYHHDEPEYTHAYGSLTAPSSPLLVRRQVTILATRDERAVKGWHQISTYDDQFVLVQVFDHNGMIITLPGAGRAWGQEIGKVFIPQLGSDRYPITVVVV